MEQLVVQLVADGVDLEGGSPVEQEQVQVEHLVWAERVLDGACTKNLFFYGHI